MKLTLQPNGQFAHGQAHSYLVTLPNDATAILDLVGGKGWHLTIRQDGKAISRGLFNTPNDIVELLRAEYYPLSRDDHCR
jgi:hypothetical protein